MAYGIYLAALPAERLESFREQLSQLRESGREKELAITQVAVEKMVLSTHALASYGTTDPELTRIVSELFDGGEILDEWYWHPFRPPMVQTYDQIKPLYLAFQKIWDELRQELQAEEIPYFEADLRPLFDLLAMADEHQYPILTFLEKPFDQERAERVFFPVNVFREWVVKEVQQHLNADNIQKVFSILNDYRRQYYFPYTTALLRLSNRYYALGKDQTSGAISTAEATQEMTSIRRDLTELNGKMNSWLQTGTDKELTLDTAEQEIKALAAAFTQADAIKNRASRLRIKNDIVRKIGEKYILNQDLSLNLNSLCENDALIAGFAHKIKFLPETDDLYYLERFAKATKGDFAKESILIAVMEYIRAGHLIPENEQRVLSLLEELDKGKGPVQQKILAQMRAALHYWTSLFKR